MLQGTIEGYEHSYALDYKHVFERDRPKLVCGNTAAVLGEGGLSHLAKHFQVSSSLFLWISTYSNVRGVFQAMKYVT